MKLMGIADGWLEDVQRIPSPNYDDRPIGDRPQVIIVHAISLPPRNYGGGWVSQLFSNTLDFEKHEYFRSIRGFEVSAHFLVCRTGDWIQYVSTVKRAWHAGQSECLGRSGVNDFSIGIELEGCDDESFTRIQYASLAKLISQLLNHYPSLSQERLFGHSEIAPGRKTDPGPCFDWSKLRLLLDRE
ncbi:MAG: AmpD protein [Parasphingorhabdus sp.]|jgi:AmpD protein